MLEKVVDMLPVINLDMYGAFILFLGLFFFYLLYKANRQKNLVWTDLITMKGTNFVSLTKLLQLIGGIVGTWLIVKLTLQEKMTPDYLMIYLAYVGAIEAWSKFVSARYGGFNSNNGNGNGNGGYEPTGYQRLQSVQRPLRPTPPTVGVDEADLDAALPPEAKK